MSASKHLLQADIEEQARGSGGFSQPSESLSELKGLDLGRIEASWAAIAAQHKLPHRRLLALDWAAKFHGIPSGTFRKGFELWLESNTEGGEG
jgi:hypothetical protein